MTMIRRLLLPLLLFALSLGAFAQEAPKLIVEAPAGLEGTAARLRAIDPSRLASAMRLTGLQEPGPPIRVLLAPEGSAGAVGVPPWVSGYAMGEQGVIVLLPGRVPSYPDSSLSDLLAHEVAHVLVARAAGGRPLPRWFHEGLAMIAGLSWGLEDRSRLTLALLTDRPVSLAALDEHFAGGQGEVNRAYAIAGSFVRDLFEQEGPDVAARILAGVSRGLSFEDAFQAATGKTLLQAESSFWERQTFWYRWVPVLTSSVALWMLVTALAIWAIRRRRARDAAQRRIWEEEEERSRLAALAAEEQERQTRDGEWIH
ncbi:MAG: peptidase MA family metallohydrolase [Thermoanaerobaculia bacterium]